MKFTQVLERARVAASTHGALEAEARRSTLSGMDVLRLSELLASEDEQLHDEFGARSPLSGEFGDELTPYGLAAALGVRKLSGLELDELCEVYESAYYEAYLVKLTELVRGEGRDG